MTIRYFICYTFACELLKLYKWTDENDCLFSEYKLLGNVGLFWYNYNVFYFAGEETLLIASIWTMIWDIWPLIFVRIFWHWTKPRPNIHFHLTSTNILSNQPIVIQLLLVTIRWSRLTHIWTLVTTKARSVEACRQHKLLYTRLGVFCLLNSWNLYVIPCSIDR